MTLCFELGYQEVLNFNLESKSTKLSALLSEKNISNKF